MLLWEQPSKFILYTLESPSLIRTLFRSPVLILSWFFSNSTWMFQRHHKPNTCKTELKYIVPTSFPFLNRSTPYMQFLRSVTLFIKPTIWTANLLSLPVQCSSSPSMFLHTHCSHLAQPTSHFLGNVAAHWHIILTPCLNFSPPLFLLAGLIEKFKGKTTWIPQTHFSMHVFT